MVPVMPSDGAARAKEGDLLLLTAAAGCAMSLVDTNIVALAIPAIARGLRAGAADTQWVISAFFLSFAAMLLPAGAIADRLGRRRITLCGLAGLAAASLSGGLASTVVWLHLSRGAQGAATAFVLAPALAIIGHRFHAGAERNRAWAIWGGVMGATMVVAPIAGGIIVESLGWRWAFFINLPICALLAAATLAYAEESRDPTRGRLDPLGILLFAGAMLGLTSGLITGQAQGWASTATLAGFALGAVSLVGFVIAERVQAHAMLDLQLFKSRQFIGAVWAMFAYAATAQVMASLFPIFLQHGGGLSATATGFAMLPFAFAMLAFPYLGGMLGRRLRSPSILALGLAVVAMGNAVAAWGAVPGNWLVLLPGMFVIGAGAGLLNGETQKAIMMTIPRERVGMASGISTTARFSGILIGFVALNAVLASGIRAAAIGAECLAPATCGAGRGYVDAVIAGDFSAAIAGTPVLDMALAWTRARQLYASGASASLLAAALLAALSAGLVWWLMRPRRSGA
jgi:MFS family permease